MKNGGHSLCNPQVGEVMVLDTSVENGKTIVYRVEVNVSFKYEKRLHGIGESL